jgi:hypothetical protein
MPRQAFPLLIESNESGERRTLRLNKKETIDQTWSELSTYNPTKRIIDSKSKLVRWDTYMIDQKNQFSNLRLLTGALRDVNSAAIMNNISLSFERQPQVQSRAVKR